MVVDQLGYIKGVLTQSMIVNGVIKNYSYNEKVYVEV